MLGPALAKAAAHGAQRARLTPYKDEEVPVLEQGFVGGIRPHRFVEVDAARLLLILDRFAVFPSDETRRLTCASRYEFERHFASEYYLQKLDFLLRYPRYFAFELIELHAAQDGPAADADTAKASIREVLSEGAPELHTEPFVRFWRGAYERLDDVESWWFARELVFIGREVRGNGPTWKHYFVTAKGTGVANRLQANVEQTRWYAQRLDAIHRFMGHLSAAQIRDRQYRHRPYRDAHLNQLIPDLSNADIKTNFEQVFEEPLEVPLG